jgi:Zn-dependent protease with chaperone function
MIALRRLTLPLLMAAACAVSGCAYNADLGRDQLLIVNDDNLAADGEKAWADTLRTAYISKEPRKNARVQAVGQRVITAAGLAGRPWDYAVFLDEAPNAFVLPGGHVGVTVGLLSMAQNDDQLAAVIGTRLATSSPTTLPSGCRRSGPRRSCWASPGRRPAAPTSASCSRTTATTRPSTACCCRSRASRSWRPIAWRRFHAARRLPATRGRGAVAQHAGPGRGPRARASGGQLSSTHPSDAVRIAELERYLASKGW